MIFKVKRGRVWLPNNREYKNRFLEISINFKDKIASFIATISKDGRLYIPIKIREEYRIENENEVLVKEIKILNNIKRKKQILSKNGINILPAIPQKTLSGYEILVTEKKEKYLCWYCTQGRPKEVALNKRVPKSFARFLGYYQAEGGKPILRKRRGRTFSFSNTKLYLIRDFFELSKLLIDPTLWNISIRCNPNFKKEFQYDLINKLEEIGIKSERIKLSSAERIKKYTLILWFANSIFAETIDKLNAEIKKLLTKHNSKEIFEEYFRGVIAGDGNFSAHRDKNGSLHSRLSIYEEKEESIRKYKEILIAYGIPCKIKKAKNKNLYVLMSNCNWDILLSLLKSDIFLYAPHHKSKLIWTIKNHKRYSPLKHIANIGENFDIEEIKNLTNKENSYNFGWIRDRKDEGFICDSKIGSKKKNWMLTKKGKELKKVLSILL